MEGKRYSNSFTSSGMVKEEGRMAYYKLLDRVRDGDAVRIKRGVYATAEQLADTMIDVQAIVPGGVLCLFSAWNVHGLTTSLPQARESQGQVHRPERVNQGTSPYDP